MPTHAHPLVVRLYAEAVRRGVTIERLAILSGVPSSTIEGWRYRHNPSVQLLVACFNAIGFDLVPRERIPETHRAVGIQFDGLGNATSSRQNSRS